VVRTTVELEPVAAGDVFLQVAVHSRGAWRSTTRMEAAVVSVICLFLFASLGGPFVLSY
jgi:hypothetical protein